MTVCRKVIWLEKFGEPARKSFITLENGWKREIRKKFRNYERSEKKNWELWRTIW